MIVGDPSIFAIESQITTAFERPSLRGIGFFIIHVLGQSYGVRSPEATALACSLDTIQKRLDHRGRHVAPFSLEPKAGRIADAVRQALYADQPKADALFGYSQAHFEKLISANEILWAPDGDEAFDDSSFVLHLDVGERVRLIAFRSTSTHSHDAETLRDAWLPAGTYYKTLEQWRDAFIAEWQAMAKTAERADHHERRTKDTL